MHALCLNNADPLPATVWLTPVQWSPQPAAPRSGIILAVADFAITRPHYFVALPLVIAVTAALRTISLIGGPVSAAELPVRGACMMQTEDAAFLSAEGHWLPRAGDVMHSLLRHYLWPTSMLLALLA